MDDAKEIQPRWSFAIFLSHGALRKSKEKREEAAGEMSRVSGSLARLRIERRFDKGGRTTEKVKWS